MKQSYNSLGYPIRCKCGEWAKWCLVGNNGSRAYVCEGCYEKHWKDKSIENLKGWI